MAQNHKTKFAGMRFRGVVLGIAGRMVGGSFIRSVKICFFFVASTIFGYSITTFPKVIMPKPDLSKFPPDLRGRYWAFAYEEDGQHIPSYRLYLGIDRVDATEDLTKLRGIHDLIFVTRETLANLTLFFDGNDSLRPITPAEQKQIMGSSHQPQA